MSNKATRLKKGDGNMGKNILIIAGDAVEALEITIHITAV